MKGSKDPVSARGRSSTLPARADLLALDLGKGAETVEAAVRSSVLRSVVANVSVAAWDYLYRAYRSDVDPLGEMCR